MEEKVKKGKLIVIAICVCTVIIGPLRGILNWWWLNIIVYAYMIFGLYYGHRVSRYIAAAVYALSAVRGLCGVLQLIAGGGNIGYIVCYMVITIVSALCVYLLMYNKSVEEYLYYMEVG